MLLIEDYISQPKIDRQKHIDLSDPCIERGGPQKGGLSSYCKGLMAHLFDTTIPSGHKIHVCHACNNERCCNPNHLYWGTAQENRLDQGEGNSVWDRMVKKYGYDEACRLNAKGRNGNQNASGNKGNTLTEEHKRNIAANHKGGRKKIIADVA